MNLLQKIKNDYEQRTWLSSPDLETYVLEKYGWNLRSDLGGVAVKNPWGKAAGQLSLNTTQVERDINGGLAFVVLKTVIAQEKDGASVQSAWMVEAPRMLVERITAKTGEEGWTVSWKGRGWSGSFQSYLDFVEESLALAKEHGSLIIPSVQVPLFTGPENPFEAEYAYTLTALGEILQQTDAALLEMDLSPTLLKDGPPLGASDALNQLEVAVPAVRRFLPPNVKLGLKLFNLFDPLEQVSLVREGAKIWGNLDWLTIGNRLFSKRKGISYGGYDLSNRNLAVLDAVRSYERQSQTIILPTSISATGNICSGKMLVEYAQRGCTTGQLHTFFQVPKGEYGYDLGSRSRSALHQLMFNPQDGLLVSLERLREIKGYTGHELSYGEFFQKGGD